jgi:hypothetical protein
MKIYRHFHSRGGELKELVSRLLAVKYKKVMARLRLRSRADFCRVKCVYGINI